MAEIGAEKWPVVVEEVVVAAAVDEVAVVIENGTRKFEKSKTTALSLVCLSSSPKEKLLYFFTYKFST